MFDECLNKWVTGEWKEFWTGSQTWMLAHILSTAMWADGSHTKSLSLTCEMRTLAKSAAHNFFFFFLVFSGFYFILYFLFIYFYTVVVFVIHWHESAMDLHVFPIPIHPPTSLSIRFLWVFPVHQARALVSCIQPGLVICFTLDNIHVSMLFSLNIPPSPSPIESKILFCTSVPLFLFCI